MKEIRSYLGRMRELAIKSKNKNLTTTDLSYLNIEFISLKEQILDIESESNGYMYCEINAKSDANNTISLINKKLKSVSEGEL